LAIGRARAKVRAEPPGRETEQAAMLARRYQRLDVSVLRQRTHQQADMQETPRAPGGTTHRLGVIEVERQRRLAEHVLARLQRRDHARAMDRTWQADIDCIDVAARDQDLPVADRLGAAERSG